MLIAFFTNNYKPFVGGVPIAIEHTARMLRRRGHRVLIFAPDYDGDVQDEPDVFRVLSIKNFNNTPFSLPLPLTLRPAYDLDTLSQVDVVHVHHPFLLGMSGLQLARAYNLPVVFTYHTQYEKYIHYLPFPQQMTAELAIRLSTRFANSCDAVIAPSSDIRKTLIERGVQVPVHVLPTGVDLQKFRGGQKDFLRKKFNLSAETQIVLTVSRLAKEKNISFLIRAFARLCTYNSQAVFVLVGRGDAEDDLKALARDLGIANRVYFAGELVGKELVSAYKGADVFVFASTTETQGLVVLESMACGVPPVVVDAPGVRDFVHPGVNGFMVPEDGEADFAERVLTLLDDEVLRKALGAEALKTARRWSLRQTTSKLERIYKSLSTKGQPRGKRERFIMLRELISYQFEKLLEEVDKLF
jgi:glycosyltransferase involved in cell wall biosynthesis